MTKCVEQTDTARDFFGEWEVAIFGYTAGEVAVNSVVGPLGHQAEGLSAYRRAIYDIAAIQSFKCSDTQALFDRKRVKRFMNIEAVARRKLVQLNAAATLDFLRVPPGNQLEALKGDRAGQHSIRVNDQFRVCFVWTAQGPKDVEIVDYH